MDASLAVIKDFDDSNLAKLFIGEITDEEYNYLMSREIAYRLSNQFEWDYAAGKGGLFDEQDI